MARPKVHTTTTWRATRTDLANMEAIAKALRDQTNETWPTRASALRFALKSVAAHLDQTGRLPF